MPVRRDNSDKPGAARAGPRRRGITLVETVISLLLVSVMLVGALNLLGSASVADQVHATQRRGAVLAAQLMAEILSNDYADTGGSPVFGPEPGEAGGGSRRKFDDVDDYHGWSSSPPEDKDGTAVSGLSGWTRAVTVQYVDPADVNAVVGSDQGLVRITVTVTDAQDRPTVITSIHGDTSAYQYTPSSSTTYVNRVDVALQVGSNERARVFAARIP